MEQYKPNRPNKRIRTLEPTIAEYKLFSSEHKTFSGIDYMLGHKTSFNKFN